MCYLTSIFIESVGVKRGEGRTTIEAFAKHDLHREKVAHIRHVFFDTQVEKVINFSHHNKFVTLPVEVRNMEFSCRRNAHLYRRLP